MLPTRRSGLFGKVFPGTIQQKVLVHTPLVDLVHEHVQPPAASGSSPGGEAHPWTCSFQQRAFPRARQPPAGCGTPRSHPRPRRARAPRARRRDRADPARLRASRRTSTEARPSAAGAFAKLGTLVWFCHAARAEDHADLRPRPTARDGLAPRRRGRDARVQARTRAHEARGGARSRAASRRSRRGRHALCLAYARAVGSLFLAESLDFFVRVPRGRCVVARSSAAAATAARRPTSPRRASLGLARRACARGSRGSVLLTTSTVLVRCRMA